jgi:hypothetical protein
MITLFQIVADGNAPEEAVSLLREMPGDVKAQGKLPFAGRYALIGAFLILRGVLRHRPRVVLTWGTAASRSCPWIRPGWRQRRWIHVAQSPGYGPTGAYRHADHLVVPTLDVAAWFVERGFDAETVHVIPALPAPKPLEGPGPLVIDDPNDVSGDRVIGAWRAGRVVVSVSSVGPAALIASEADGLLTPLGDHAALDAAIQRVGSDRSLVRRLIQGGKQRYEGDFSEEAVARRWKDLIRKLAP